MTTPKPKIMKGGKKFPKKESMELIKKTNSKITNWTISKPQPAVIEDDWSDDISIPDIRCTEEIERKENAKKKADIWIGKRICRDIIMEMICNAEGISTVSLCIQVVMDNAWKNIKERKIKKLLENDKDMVTWWDEKLLSLIAKNNLTLEQKARYMDGIRLWMYAVRLGWRWMDGSLKFSTEWRTGWVG